MKVMLEWRGPKSRKLYVRIVPSERHADSVCKWFNSVGIAWTAHAVAPELEHLKVK
jgi:hypothetical protein